MTFPVVPRLEELSSDVFLQWQCGKAGPIPEEKLPTHDRTPVRLFRLLPALQALTKTSMDDALKQLAGNPAGRTMTDKSGNVRQTPRLTLEQMHAFLRLINTPELDRTVSDLVDAGVLWSPDGLPICEAKDRGKITLEDLLSEGTTKWVVDTTVIRTNEFLAAWLKNGFVPSSREDRTKRLVPYLILNLKMAVFSGDIENYDFEDNNLEGAKMIEAHFKECRFKNVNMDKVTIKNTNFTKCNFLFCDLDNVEMTQVQISGQFPPTIGSGATLKDVYFTQGKG
jgi:hypothetical protein